MTTVRPAFFARLPADDGAPADELIERYRAGATLLRESVEGLTAVQLRARPIEGKLSSLEVLAHVADSEQYLADRMKRTVATDLPLLVGVDGRPYFEALASHDRDPELLLVLFEVTRAEMAAVLERLPAEAWAREAVHTEVGIITLRQQLLHAVQHAEGHAGAIAEKRRALGAPAGN